MVVNRIAVLAQERGISCAKLSRRSDVSNTAMYALWTNPRSDCRLSTLEKIAQALNVDVIELLIDDGTSIHQPPNEAVAKV